MRKPKIGLLPFYLELYDRTLPDVRPRMEQFRQTIIEQFIQQGLEVVTAPICRLENEFAAATQFLESHLVDALVTLHLAYSPSLESVKALSQTRLPVIVLDTTPTFEFGPQQNPDEIMYNHGIHGVQDFCNLLIREKKAFQIEAGHWEHSDVLDRVASWARAACLVSSIRQARVGRIGDPFKGMGDFQVSSEELRATLGVEVVPCTPAEIVALVPSIREEEITCEQDSDLVAYRGKGLDPDVHRRTLLISLAVRRWIEQQRLSAFTMNFSQIDRSSGFPTLPFLEASKAMARGIGYAGEGDAMTAALVGALMTVYPETTFAEMFCPDWKNQSIFLSHMGEMNVRLIKGQPRLFEKCYSFIDADNPVVSMGTLRAGDAVFVNLAPGPDQTYTLILAPVAMLDVPTDNCMSDTVNGWFRPARPVAEFIEAYSRVGGTHHAALVYGNVVNEISKFGKLMGWKVELLD